MVFDARSFLQTVTSQPGVYRMYDASETALYVGKAKDLKKSIARYIRGKLARRKKKTLAEMIQQLEVTVTHYETGEMGR